MSLSKIRKSSVSFALALALGVPLQASAALDMFLEIPGIDGESVQQGHIGDIDVLAWSWGLSQTKTGAACIQDLSATKWLDSATPALINALTAGTVLESVTLTVATSGGVAVDILVYVMTDVKVTSISSGGSGGEDRLTENVTFQFGELLGTYTVRGETGPGDSTDFTVLPGKCN